MNIKRLSLVISLFAALIPVQFSVSAQTVARKASPAPRLLASLPESDAIAHIKVKQLLNDLMPRLLGSNSAKLAEVNADIDRFKTRTGLDPRAFEEVALGVRYSYPSDGITKLQTAALAKGTFSAAAMVAAGRIAANGRYREEKYQGRTIYVFSLDQNIKLLGVLDFTVRELAASPLDANTLALGDPTSVRSVIDASLGRKRSNAGLIALANQDPDAVIGFGGNISDQVLKNLDIGNAPIENDLSGVRQVYGTVGATEKDVELFIGAKTVSAEAARNLGDTLEGLKQLGALFVGRLSGARGILARSALTNLKIAKQANELQIRTAVAQAEIAPLVGN